MLKIAIDLDNTLINTPLSIINLYNKLYKNKIKYIPNCDWKMNPMIKTDEKLSELFKLFDDKNFYQNNTLVVYDNAIDIVNELSIQNYVCIISKHDIKRRSITKEWVKKTFPRVELIFVDDFRDKGKALKEFGADIIIDDRVDALESCKDIVPYRILFGNYQWNKNTHMLRATDWSVLYKMIKNIKEAIELNNKLIEIKNNKKDEGIKRWEF